MGRAYQLNINALWLDFDGKVEGDAARGLNLGDELKLDRYAAP